jgi:hypothetical protein
MHQIVYPITAKLMHDNNTTLMNDFVKKRLLTQVVGGFVILCIFVNISQLYEKEYGGGI